MQMFRKRQIFFFEKNNQKPFCAPKMSKEGQKERFLGYYVQPVKNQLLRKVTQTVVDDDDDPTCKFTLFLTWAQQKF